MHNAENFRLKIQTTTQLN